MVGVRAGDEGLEPAAVVALEVMSPPSPSLSMAVSSTKTLRALVG